MFANVVHLGQKYEDCSEDNRKIQEKEFKTKTETDPESLGTKVNSLLKNVNVPETMKKILLIGEVT